MAVLLGLDLGTTTITALAVAADSGDILARVTVPNPADITSQADRERGHSEWDASAIVSAACRGLRQACDQMGAGWARLAGLAITGQQHGTLLVDATNRPLTPLIGWQDRRSEHPYPGSSLSYTAEAARRLGGDAVAQTGCRLASGFLATTLFWLNEQGLLPPAATACFVADHCAAWLTGLPAPVTDPTFAASAGVFDVRATAWADDLIAALGLPRSCFPEVRPAGTPLGTITREAAEATGLPAGLPVFLGVGDNQASFLGSVAERDDAELVNIGTGGQVSVFSESFLYVPELETRPFPGGYLLACVGLTGGRTYALLERFFRQVGRDLFGAEPDGALYERMNRLAEAIPFGAEGLRCLPYFSGTRQEPALRASLTGLSAVNFTPAHLTRALLEGMAQALFTGHEAIVRLTGGARRQLVGAGNAVRENRLLAHLIEETFGRPLLVPCHREEAAFGAALLAGVGAGVYADLADAGSLVRYY